LDQNVIIGCNVYTTGTNKSVTFCAEV